MTRNLLCLALALSLPGAVFAATLQPPSADDLAPTRLLALPAPAGDFERTPVQFAWALEPTAALETPAPFLAESREYWFVAEAGELARGVDLHTTAPGAVVRLSPADGRPLSPRAMRLQRDGRAIPDTQAFSARHDTATLRAAGLEVADGSAVVRLAPGLGKGAFRLQVDGARGRTLVHVFEPDSPYALRAQAERASVLAGERLAIASQLTGEGRALAAAELRGELVSPSGRRYPLQLRGDRAEIEVPLEADTPAGLWEVELYAGRVVNGLPLQREVRTAVQVSLPTARLAGDYSFDANTLQLQLPLEVASPGRYELRGTLYATGSDGVPRPVVIAHSAAWLEEGGGSLALAFDRANLPAGYGAPFEVRDLELNDQTRMGRLETRALALREGGAPGVTPVRPRR